LYFIGFNSGVMGAMILLGNVSGAAVGTCFTVSYLIDHVTMDYLLMFH